MHIRQSVFFRVDLWPLINKRILLSLLLAMYFLLSNQAAAAPRIVCEKPTYDFGTQISGAAITNRFILNNKGDEPLVISKIKNCCGVQTTVEPMTLPPGSTAVCTSVFTTKNRYGAQDKDKGSVLG